MANSPNSVKKKKSIKILGLNITKSKIKEGGVKKKLLEITKTGGVNPLAIVKTKTKIGGKNNWAPEKIKETDVSMVRMGVDKNPTSTKKLNIKKKKQGVSKEPNKISFNKY